MKHSIRGKLTVLVVAKNTKIASGIIKKYCNEASAYYYKGLALLFKNDKEQALKNFNLAIKYAKNTIVPAYYYRGNLYAFYKEDYKKEFKDIIIKDFIDNYLNGKTPNPCIKCNKYFI